MKFLRTLCLAACIAPLAAMAQTSYSRATITGDPVYVPAPRERVYVDPPRPDPVYVPAPSRFHVCMARNNSLWDRKAALDVDQRDVDREAAEIARRKAALEAEYRRLDMRDNNAVALYNARSEEYNRWVDSHNRRVAELNGASNLLNTDSAQLVAYCDNLYASR